MFKDKAELKTISKFAIVLTVLSSIMTVFTNDLLNPFSNLDNKWFDYKYYINKDIDKDAIHIPNYVLKDGDPKISIIAIDDFTTKKYGWPFKRRYYAALIDKLERLGVKAIGFDVLFMDKDRDNPENDKALIKAIAKYNNIVNLVFIEDRTLQLPIPGIIENSRYMAHPNTNTSISDDGNIRKMDPFHPPKISNNNELLYFNYKDLKKSKCKDECKDIQIPLLATALYAIYTNTTLDKIYQWWERDLKGNSITLNFRRPQTWFLHEGRKDIANKMVGNPEFNLTADSMYRHISVADVIEDKLSDSEKEAIKDGIALIGSTAIGAYDHYPSPFFAATPGVEFHANLIDNLIHRDYLRSFPFLLKTAILLIAIWLPVLLYKKNIKFITLSVLALIALYSFISHFCIRLHYDFNIATYIIIVFISYSYIIAYKSIVEGKQKKWIKNTFSQYLSSKVVDILVNNPEKLTLGGEKREMTVSFLDISGFTSMSEKMTPEELTKLLNTYLSELTEIIHKNDGVVDKYIGDCIMSFWNAPIDQKNHRTLACISAVESIEKLKELNAKTGKNLSVKIGINSGVMVVGNMGSHTRFAYTVLGDNVNLASRLEGANKFFHSKILISENVYEEAKEAVAARYLGKIKVLGKETPIAVYEPLYLKSKSGELTELFDKYNSAIDCFYKKEYEKAISIFKSILEKYSEDGPSRFYLELAENLVEKKIEFDGVFQLESK
jgi:adenylate cyclase